VEDQVYWVERAARRTGAVAECCASGHGGFCGDGVWEDTSIIMTSARRATSVRGPATQQNGKSVAAQSGLNYFIHRVGCDATSVGTPFDYDADGLVVNADPRERVTRGAGEVDRAFLEADAGQTFVLFN
jgi:hypothetical protein